MTLTVDPRFPNSIPAALVVDETQLQAFLPGIITPLRVDRFGQLLIGGTVTANITVPGMLDVTLGDSLSISTGGSVTAVPVLFNGTYYDRARSVTDNLDAVTTGEPGLTGTVSRLQVFNGTTWDRLRTLVTNADAQTAAVTGLLGTVARLTAFNGTTYDRITCSGDNADNQAVKTTGCLEALAHNMTFNGTTYDRQRGNVEATLLASAARTTSTASPDQTNYNQRGVHVIVNVTTATTGTLTVTLQGKDPVSGNYYDILVGTAISAPGMTVLKCYPGIGTLAGGSTSDILPRTWRVNCVKSDGSSWTYSVGAVTIM